MDDNILTPFNTIVSDGYLFAEVLEIKPSGLLIVSTVSGLQLSVRDDFQTYEVGDQVVIATPKGNLNNIFIIKKIDNIYPSAVNFVITNGDG